jgi:hypothetical protein
LRDLLTPTVHDLKASSYTFTSEVVNFVNRFEILYQNPLGVGNPTFNVNQVVIHKYN